MVISHDNNLDRLAGVDRLISDMNYDELPQLSEECYMELFNPTTHNAPSIPNEENRHLRRIPLMDTVCQQFPNMRFNLDIKENNDELIHKVK